tara:strand:+ start:84 stop:434 length:351 start_codon:yes stop_codon:yes gene_type:complete
MAKFANTKGLSKQEKFMIQGMIIEDNSVEDIAKYLDREMELVETFIEDFKPEAKPVEAQETSVQNLTSHVINKTAKGNNGVAVMTSAGSQQGDESHNRHNRGSHGAKSQGYTHKIK